MYYFYYILFFIAVYKYKDDIKKGYDIWSQLYLQILLFFNDDVINELEKKLIEDQDKDQQQSLPSIKYEDKFLSDIRKMEKDYIFDKTETKLLEDKVFSFFNKIIETRQNKLTKISNEIAEIDTKLTTLQESKTDIDSDIDDSYPCTKEEYIEELLFEKAALVAEEKKISGSVDTEKDVEEAEENGRIYIINNRIEKLENCYVMETTPQGNVLMIYDNKRQTFKYYSDNAIPYRYLEVVGRKYVKQFNCRQLYVDMEEELNLAEARWEKERKDKEDREKKAELELELEKERNKKVGQYNKPVEKKNVFTKFKSYNKEGTSGRVATGVPPKNSIPMTKEQVNEKILLKEKANRYTYEGKFANFSFLKKIERKAIDKKYGLTFADFKKMQHK